MTRNHKTILASVFSVAFIAHIVMMLCWPEAGLNGIDVRVYQAGAKTIFNSDVLYEGGVLGPMFYTYPPFSAILFSPLVPFSEEVVKILSLVLNLAALGGVIWIALRSLGYASSKAPFNKGTSGNKDTSVKDASGKDLLWVTLGAAGLFSWFEPVRTTLWLGQINLALLILLVFSLTRKDDSKLKGIGVGIAAGIKLTPAIFIVYLLVTRRFKAAITAIITFLGTIAVSFPIVPGDTAKYWIDRTFSDSERIGGIAVSSNQSFNGMIARLFDTDEPSKVLWFLLAAVFGFAGLYLAREASRHGRELFAIAVVGLTSTAVSPFSWEHHWVWFIPLTIALVHEWRLSKNNWLLGSTAAIYLMTFAWMTNFPAFREKGSPSSGIFAITAPGWLQPLSYNIYLWVFVLVLVIGFLYLRTLPSTERTGVTVRAS